MSPIATGRGRRSDPVAGSQAVFRVLLDAMARPGTLHHLPAADPDAPVPHTGPLAAIAQTLLDHEVSFAVVPRPGDTSDDDGDRFAAYLTLVTGSHAVAPIDADYIFALGALPAGLPATLRTGVPAYPDESATMIALVPAFAAQIGVTVTLAGPGVAPGTRITVPGLTPADLASLAAANAEPPLGVDLILIDPAGTVVCLPRSTRLTLDESSRRRGGDVVERVSREEDPDGLHRG